MAKARAIDGRLDRTAVAAPAEVARSLDPQDWNEFRQIAHDALDQAIDFLATARERPVWQPIPEHVKSTFAGTGLPIAPSAPQQLVAEIMETVFAHSCGNTHPRFFGWVHGTGTAGGVIADMMAAAVNANLGGRDHAAIYVERQVIDWCRRMFGLPEGAGGLLVSGTSMATMIALTIARNQAAARFTDVRRKGLQGLNRRLVAYTSAEAHGSVVKALELLGVGRDWVRAVPVDAALRMDVGSLAAAIAADRAAGHHPFAVIATAGTVNTGALDPLSDIADLCADEKLWFHVDGAFGGLGVLSSAIKPRLAGIERADSIAFDFHKWLHVTYDAGCVLVRRGEAQLETFSQRPPYLAGSERGLAAGEPWFCEMGPELSRGFRALKVWFTLKEHGLDRLGAKIDDNCAQARYLADRIAGLDGFELMAPVSLNIACFRVAHDSIGPEATDKLNSGIVVDLQERGIAAPSTTKLGGRTAIRVNITNHRTTFADIDILVDALREIAADRLFEALAPTQTPVEPVPDPISLGQLAIDDDRRYRRLGAVLARPEIAPLADGIEVLLDTNLSQPFLVHHAHLVHVGATVLDAPDGAATAVRHALELARWLEAAGDRKSEPAWVAAISLLSARCGALYLGAMPDTARMAATSALPQQLRTVYERLARARDWADLRELLLPGASMTVELLSLLNGGTTHLKAVSASAAVKADAADIVLRVATLAVPSEVLMTQGGDGRVTPLSSTGRNAYGTATAPQPGELCFSSSTATNVSEAAYRSVEALRLRLIKEAIAGKLDASFRRQMAHVRREVARITGAAKVSGSAVVITASGTDTELLALDFAHGANHRHKLVSIVVDPNETGSGVPLAAAGKHYLARTSQGHVAQPAAAIDGLGSNEVSVVCVPLRTADGAARRSADIDAEIERIAQQAIASGARCLVHILDASKTGQGAPGIELSTRLLERYPDDVDVVVDACQMRLGCEAMRAYLERGFMLQVTASKFYTAPPFAGALVLPRQIARRQRKPLPKGLASYIGAAEWPAALERRLHVPAGRANLGLLARWTAGLHEIRSFERVPMTEVRAILERLNRDVTAMIAVRHGMRVAAAPVFDRASLDASDDWGNIATIIPFELVRRRDDGQDQPLSFDELRMVYRLMTENLSARLSPATGCSAQAAATPCHLGQPVKTGVDGGKSMGVVRLCVSARHVAEVYGNGDGSMEQYRTLLQQIALILDKADAVVASLEALA